MAAVLREQSLIRQRRVWPRLRKICWKGVRFGRCRISGVRRGSAEPAGIVFPSRLCCERCARVGPDAGRDSARFWTWCPLEQQGEQNVWPRSKTRGQGARREQGGSPSAAGAKRGRCFLSPGVLRALCSFQGYPSGAMSVPEGCGPEPRVLLQQLRSWIWPRVQKGESTAGPRSHPDNGQPRQQPSGTGFSRPGLIKRLFSEGDEVREAWGLGGGV